MTNIISEYKKLIEQLHSVKNAEVFAVDGTPTEIHILSDDSRTPKQIMRDVQSAISAKFKIRLDHKIISIAQIPEASTSLNLSPRVKYLGVTTSFTPTECSVSVALECAQKKYVGKETCDLDSTNRCRATAEATVNAVNEYIKGKASISLKSVKAFDVEDCDVVSASVIFYHAQNSEILVGSCIEKDDMAPTVVKAVLDAVNRKISTV